MAVKRRNGKAATYKVISISMYDADLEQLSEKVAELRKRGYSRWNKSRLIRHALRRVDINALCKEVEPWE